MMLETELFRVEPDIVVVSCAGRFTMGTRLKQTEAMSDTLVAEGARKLVLDLTHTETVDSAGLGVIMHMSAEMEQAGGAFRICGANERIQHLLSVTHTDTLLPHDPDLESSVRNLGGDSERLAAADG
jgi:anti-sigma B factor antagonist